MATQRNPKDSMKSTWRDNKKTWGLFHYMYDVLRIYPTSPDAKAPVHAKTDKVPYIPTWTAHRLALMHALVPLGLHQAYVQYTGKNLNFWAALALYTVAFKVGGIHNIQQLKRLGMKYGHFDGDVHPRDEVPDHSVRSVFLSLMNTSSVRSLFTIFLGYNKAKTPADINLKWLLPELSLYGIVLDFYFYWYHRCMHESDTLWKFHRTHHLTKHPNPLLTLYADTVQEVIDIAGIPLLTYFTMKAVGMPMGFYEWWICHQYVMLAELSGHSGLRAFGPAPNPVDWLLRLFGCELVIEDHDLHHRRGWKKSGNYGKQTRLWDTIFGTKLDRIECTEDNIDWNTPAPHPII